MSINSWATLPWLALAVLLIGQPVAAEPAAATVPEAAGTLTLAQAVAVALAHSPQLRASDFARAAARGAERQAGLHPNPEAGIQTENIAGGGPYRGYIAAMTTLSLTQELQTGGKRAARQQLAGRELSLANANFEAAALDLVRDVTIAYADALTTAERVRLAEEQRQLAEEVLRSVTLRVNAAAAPLLQKSRAGIERAAADLALDQARRGQRLAEARLAVLLGGTLAPPLHLKGALFSALLPFEAASDSASDSVPEVVPESGPELRRLALLRGAALAQLALEEANAIPNPRFTIGIRDFRDSRQRAFVVGVSTQLPLFNLNQGNIARARGEADRTGEEQRQMVLALPTLLMQEQERMAGALQQIRTLEGDILPAARRAFRLAREGYALGRFPYLDVLDAQRNLFSIRQQEISAWQELHVAQATAARIAAAHLAAMQKQTGNHGE